MHTAVRGGGAGRSRLQSPHIMVTEMRDHPAAIATLHGGTTRKRWQGARSTFVVGCCVLFALREVAFLSVGDDGYHGYHHQPSGSRDRSILFRMRKSIRDAQGAPDDQRRLDVLLNALSTLSAHLGVPASLCEFTNDSSTDAVCPETKPPFKNSRAFHCDKTVDVDQDTCDREAENPDWSVLVTLVADHDTDRHPSEDLTGNVYAGMKVMTVEPTTSNVPTRLKAWAKLISSIRTPYVLMGWDLRVLTSWANLERSVRILAGDASIGAVAGAARNSTGHWRTSCHQARFQNRIMSLLPGYAESTCQDCMVCDVVAGAPFLTRAELLRSQSLPAASKDIFSPAALLSWFLELKESGLHTVLCPDILYLTEGKADGDFSAGLSHQQWMELGKEHGFHGVSTDPSPVAAHVFSCGEIGLVCEPWDQQSKSEVLPWCCLQSYAHMLHILDQLAGRYGFHYELTMGFILGAVKLGHFLPWDIDGDLHVQASAHPLFRPGGVAKREMEAEGIYVYRHHTDSYRHRGEGYFNLWYGGVEVEVMGAFGNMTLGCHEDEGLDGVPTRVRVGDTWARTHVNPGAYARLHYGPGHLRHTQSYRYVGDMRKGAAAGWRRCDEDAPVSERRRRRRHRCLETLPTDGNLLFHPKRFEGWRRGLADPKTEGGKPSLYKRTAYSLQGLWHGFKFNPL